MVLMEFANTKRESEKVIYSVCSIFTSISYIIVQLYFGDLYARQNLIIPKKNRKNAMKHEHMSRIN